MNTDSTLRVARICATTVFACLTACSSDAVDPAADELGDEVSEDDGVGEDCIDGACDADAEILSPTSPMQSVAFDIYGKLEFVADYDAFTRVGQVPNGKTSLPYLRVCAYDRDDGDGGVDFKYTDYSATYGNDDLLGCDVADAAGNYSISAVWTDASEPAPDIYLMTKLCNDDYTGTGTDSPAEVCVRINAAEGSEDEPENLKVIWSEAYLDASIANGAQISWNLSCPNQTGLGLGTVSCTSTEPASWTGSPSDWCACDQSKPWKSCVNKVDCSTHTCSDTNSRYGCNKEAVHVYRAIIEPYKTWGSNRPTASSTYQAGADGCPDSTNGDYCDDPECQDEFNAHLAKVEDAAHSGSCDPLATANGASDYDDSCIITPTQPFRVVHEQGHNIDMRWKCSTSGHGGDEDKKETREGFANFIAAAAWFDETATQPKYCDGSSCYDVETGTECDGNEKNVTRFFWDLRDTQNAAGEGDTEQSSTGTVRNVLSAFLSGTIGTPDPRVGPGGAEEVDPGPNGENGANVLDYLYWWDDRIGASASVCDILQNNCVDGHSDTLLTGDLDDICP